jgi:hypothetical protein
MMTTSCGSGEEDVLLKNIEQSSLYTLRLVKWMAEDKKKLGKDESSFLDIHTSFFTKRPVFVHITEGGKRCTA